MWKAQLVTIRENNLIVKYYADDGREYEQAYNFVGTETIAQLRAPIIARVAELDDLDSKKAAMAVKLAAYIGKDIA